MTKAPESPTTPRRINPLGAFSLIPGAITVTLAVWLSRAAHGQPEGGGGGHQLELIGVGMTITFYIGLIALTLFSGCIGTLAALFGLVRPPRWQAILGLTLNLAVPLAYWLFQ